jgi:hypothetical protein
MKKVILPVMTLLTMALASQSVYASKNSTACKQFLTKTAQNTIDAAKVADGEDSPNEHLMLNGDPELSRKNLNGNDLWIVPVVIDGEGCYGQVKMTVKTGTCKLVGKPRFNGVTCTDD